MLSTHTKEAKAYRGHRMGRNLPDVGFGNQHR
jgi:hypothetical protein